MNGNSGSMIQTQRGMIYRAPIFIKARNYINKSDKIKILHETEGKWREKFYENNTKC